MFTINPFSELTGLISPIAMQMYVIAMVILVVGGTLLDTIHKKSAKYFFENAEKAKALATERIKAMPSPAHVAEAADIIITMLSTPEAVQDVALGEDGFISTMTKGNVWIDCSTVNPSFSEQMADLTDQLGFNFLDAPVAGSL